MANKSVSYTDQDHLINITRGVIGGYSLISKFGRNSDVDTGTVPEDIWQGGGVYTGFPTGAAETLHIFSSSTNDTAVGSGARTYKIFGLDAQFNEISETVTFNGTTAVTTTNSYVRMNRGIVMTSGSSNQAFNAGTITVRHSSTSANVFSIMTPGVNQTQIAAYTIPANKTGYLIEMHAGIAGATSAQADLVIWQRNFGASPRLTRAISTAANAGTSDVDFKGGVVLEEKTDIAVRCIAVSANNSDIFTGFTLVLVDNVE